VLNVVEIERVLAEPDLSGPLGLRNRAILETLYSTGLRRSELVDLKLYDLDVAHGVLLVRHGKGGKDRMVPVGERALAWLDRYLLEVRPELVREPDEGFVFLTKDGNSLLPATLNVVARRYLRSAGVAAQGSCHLFRHTMATQMMEDGAGLRFVQEMLGHAQPASTEVYTHVAIGKLKEIHAATHPGARLPCPPRILLDEQAGDADEAHDGRSNPDRGTPPRQG
jgi:integrase/recombinase XerD